jgi:hypothetical protein
MGMWSNAVLTAEDAEFAEKFEFLAIPASAGL